MYRNLVFLLSFLAMLSGPPALALDAAGGRALLTVSGRLTVTNDGDRAVFDMELLKSLDWREIETHTPFTEGLQRFAGPTLASLLDALGVTGGTLEAVALNDYTIDIPVTDAKDFGVLLAVEHNGEVMRPRNKGPIWVIYPAKGDVPMRDAYGSRMIWQLHRITVKP